MIRIDSSNDDIDRKSIDEYFKQYRISNYKTNIVYDNIGSAEANATRKGIICINKNKYKNTIRKSVFDHEVAHQLCNYCDELQTDVIMNYGYVWGNSITDDGVFKGFDGNYGGYNPEEAFCDSFSYYLNFPDNLKRNYPDAYEVLEHLYKIQSIKDFYDDWYNAAKEQGVELK